jgi:anaphase-promoting complex subunit 4
VNGRKGKRAIVVLGSDRKHYRVLDMDFRKGGGGAESDGEDEEGDVEMGGA